MSESDTKLAIASRLREARRLSGLSQGQVAKMMDWHRPTVSQIEAADRNVSAEELGKLAKIYDVSPAWVLGSETSSDDLQDARLQLAARELKKLKPDDLDRLLQVLSAMRREGEG